MVERKDSIYREFAMQREQEQDDNPPLNCSPPTSEDEEIKSYSGGTRQRYPSTFGNGEMIQLNRMMSISSDPFRPSSPIVNNYTDMIFDVYKEADTEVINVNRFLNTLRQSGVKPFYDPRLVPMVDKLKEISKEKGFDDYADIGNMMLDKETFRSAIASCLLYVMKALQCRLIIPDWKEFCRQIEVIYEDCKSNVNGQVASYIPQLKRADPNHWGVSICTIDGQRRSFGNSKVPFCFQSVSKAFTYAIALNELGPDHVHKFVGQEPSGRLFNDICLDYANRPHNPLINAGAIVVCSLLKPDACLADRFDFILSQYKRMAGNIGYIGFNNPVFLSERETADRNYALSYYMREHKCFPAGVNLRQTLDLYFQVCSLEVECETAAVMASTLANGEDKILQELQSVVHTTQNKWICPITGEKVLSNMACRDTLSLMYSCGMYDYSGQFAFNVGLPAKSGVSGALILVVPNCLGISLFSPPLDVLGNPPKGLQFCKQLVERFNFHNYDSLVHGAEKKDKVDPRRRLSEQLGEQIIYLLFSAKAGDIGAIKRYMMQGINFNACDYDGRTALHVAASEGHRDVVEFLLKVAKVEPSIKDRYEQTPLDNARSFGHSEIVELIETNSTPQCNFVSIDKNGD